MFVDRPRPYGQRRDGRAVRGSQRCCRGIAFHLHERLSCTRDASTSSQPSRRITLRPTMRKPIDEPAHEVPAMLIEPASRAPQSWEADPAHDRIMLALQYLVAFVAVAAAGLMGLIH